MDLRLKEFMQFYSGMQELGSVPGDAQQKKTCLFAEGPPYGIGASKKVLKNAAEQIQIMLSLSESEKTEVSPVEKLMNESLRDKIEMHSCAGRVLTKEGMLSFVKKQFLPAPAPKESSTGGGIETRDNLNTSHVCPPSSRKKGKARLSQLNTAPHVYAANARSNVGPLLSSGRLNLSSSYPRSSATPHHSVISNDTISRRRKASVPVTTRKTITIPALEDSLSFPLSAKLKLKTRG